MAERDLQTCPPDLLAQVASLARDDTRRGQQLAADLARDYPRDARLHFLNGSLLVGLERYGEAHEAMATAVELAPRFVLARFQLGLLELSSGNASAAELTWGPLEDLPADDALRIFAQGLRALIADRFADAVRLLGQGIMLNTDNPLVSADMRLIIKTIEERGLTTGAGEPISAAHLLLQHYADKTTKH